MELFVQQTLNAIALGGTYALLALGSCHHLLGHGHDQLRPRRADDHHRLHFAWPAASGRCALHRWPPPWRSPAPCWPPSPWSVSPSDPCATPARRHHAGDQLRRRHHPADPVPEPHHQAFASRSSCRTSSPRRSRSAGSPSASTRSSSISVTLVYAAGAQPLPASARSVGIAMRAAAEDFPVARLMGVRANAVISGAFAISGLLAGVAGVLWVAQRASVDPLMGFVPVLEGLHRLDPGRPRESHRRRRRRLRPRLHRDLSHRLSCRTTWQLFKEPIGLGHRHSACCCGGPMVWCRPATSAT